MSEAIHEMIPAPSHERAWTVEIFEQGGQVNLRFPNTMDLPAALVILLETATKIAAKLQKASKTPQIVVPTMMPPRRLN